jgi:hypothetical protein
MTIMKLINNVSIINMKKSILLWPVKNDNEGIMCEEKWWEKMAINVMYY